MGDNDLLATDPTKCLNKGKILLLEQIEDINSDEAYKKLISQDDSIDNMHKFEDDVKDLAKEITTKKDTHNPEQEKDLFVTTHKKKKKKNKDPKTVLSNTDTKGASNLIGDFK